MTDEAPAFPVIYRFKGNGSTYIAGVPARDLTLQDYDLLEDGAKADLLANVQRGDSLYDQLQKVGEARAATKSATTKPAGRGKKKAQIDPDPNSPSRVDSDVITPGQAVPPADEPIGEGAAGFTQSDSAPAHDPQEG